MSPEAHYQFDRTTRRWRPASPSDPLHPPSRLAATLALANGVQRAVDAGVVSGEATAAHRLGMSRPALAHAMALLHLAPALQEAILLRGLDMSHRRLLEIATEPNWGRQSLIQDSGRATWDSPQLTVGTCFKRMQALQ